MARETIDPIQATLGTTLGDVPGALVPANEEWNVKLMTACHRGTGAGSATIDIALVSPTSTVRYIARNVAITNGDMPKNFLGPAMCYFGPGWKVQARASIASVIDLTISASRRVTS